jgi:hypothetical protein
MFTSRKHTFQIKNTSKIKMKYRLEIVNPAFPDYPDNGYFTAAPKYGEILSGMTEDIRVTFAPSEVDVNCSRILLVKIQNLDPK